MSEGVTMGSEQLDHEPLRCACGKIAMMAAKGVGFCKDHKGQAETATKALGSGATGRKGAYFQTWQAKA